MSCLIRHFPFNYTQRIFLSSKQTGTDALSHLDPKVHDSPFTFVKSTSEVMPACLSSECGKELRDFCPCCQQQDLYWVEKTFLSTRNIHRRREKWRGKSNCPSPVSPPLHPQRLSSQPRNNPRPKNVLKTHIINNVIFILPKLLNL